MISFEPTEEQQLIVGTVADFAKSALAPRTRDFEKAKAISDEVRRAIQEMGLGLAAVPESLGGQGLGLLTAVMINEELALGDAATPFAIPSLGAFPIGLLELASDEQQKAQFADGEPAPGAVAWSERRPSPRAGFTTVAKAVDGGFEITGQKAFVGNAELAKQFIVFAQVDESRGWNGIGAFLVASDNPGLRVSSRHKTLGLDGASFGEVTLESARVPTASRLEGRGDFIRACLRFFAKYSLLVAARQCGLSRTAFEVAREYCDIRKAFGKPIGHFQAVAFTLADRHIDTESARELIRRAAWSWDAGREEKQSLLFTAQAVAQAHETAMRCADDSVQLHGGAGFMRDVIVEKLMRDAKQMALCGSTAEQMDQVAAAIEIDAPLDPALVLPTPDSQAVFT